MNEPLLTAEEIDRTAAEFRYARDLVTAAEMHSWLASCDLDVEDWMEFILRSCLRTRWADEIPEIVNRYPVRPVLSWKTSPSMKRSLEATLAAWPRCWRNE